MVVQTVRFAILLAAALQTFAADPTFIHRYIPAIAPAPDDLTAGARGVEYRPAFGARDPQARHLKGVARYGELTVQPGGASALVAYPAEEQIYYILSGSGAVIYAGERLPVKPDDFLYLPINLKHGVENTASSPLRLLVMGFKIPAGVTPAPTPKPLIANASDVALTTVSGHGPSSLFKLLMGTTESKRDKLAAANQMVSLSIMDFAPGGTNIPHHHEMEEEIYYILRGQGEMVAGGGADGNEGRYPARQGDAWFIRLNTTVGFYSGAKPGGDHDLVLAVRSRFPFPKRAAGQ